jgi:CRISPR-associated endonuclease Cas1
MTDQSISPVAATYADTGTTDVMIADGYCVSIRVTGGHLHISDGVGRSRRERRVPRMPRTVKRLVILSSAGMMTAESVRWLADAGIGWVHLDHQGETIATSGPRTANSRLLRSQAMAGQSPAALEIARLLITAKLAGQADALAKYLPGDAAAYIRSRVGAIDQVETVAGIGGAEGKAADAYWSAWAGRVMVPFSPEDLLRVPAHWRHFEQRRSLKDCQPMNGDATDPVNAVLNYLYRIAESECVHACHAYGLSPVLGVSHADKPGRDSMALDLMEVIRPACDSIALGMMSPDGVIPYAGNRPAYTDRQWFTETREGTCRLVAPLTHQLASHAAELGALVMPYAREIAAILARHADGVTTVPNIGGVKRLGHGGARPHSYPAAQLRPGVTVNDVIPDDVWARVERLLPVPEKPKRGPHYSASPREVAAALTIRYVMRCPWKDVPMAHKHTVARWLTAWEASGAWDNARQVIEANGHLAGLSV